MYIKNHTAKALYRAIILILCEAAIVIKFAYASDYGINSVVTLACYYTVIGTAICFFYFGYLLIFKPKSEKPVVKGAVTMCVLLASIVYHFLLSGSTWAFAYTGNAVNFSNLLIYTVIPLAVFTDYILFTPKGSFKSFDPLIWTLIPIGYLAFIIIRAKISPLKFIGFGETPSRYPYPFMDFDLLGTGKAVGTVVIIAVMYIALGYILYVIDRFLSKKRK